MLKGVIFDMDGVLVDNMAVHVKVFERFCDKLGRSEGAAFANDFAGMGNEEIMPLVLRPDVVARYGAKWLGAEKERMYREYYSERMVVAPGLVHFLDSLRDAGIKRAVGSSAITENVDLVLDGCGIRQYFDEIANGDMVERHKPEPDIFLLAAGKLGLEPHECLVIEDAVTGIKAAHAAGMKVVALTTTFDADTLALSHPNMIVGGFPELSVEMLKMMF